MIDLHTHVLAGIDDGPATLDESLALARASLAAGVPAVVATPHVSVACPNDAARVGAALDALREALERDGVPLTVHPGAEIEIELAAALDDAELCRLRLGDGSYLLLECPLSTRAGDIEPLVDAILRRGHDVVLAHPERSPLLQRDPAQLARLVAHGALTSVTAGALGGRFGAIPCRFARELLAGGLVHNVASDMHDVAGRPPGIRAALGELAGDVEDLDASLRWLAEEVPAAILAGAQIPAGPAIRLAARPSRRRSRWWRRR